MAQDIIRIFLSTPSDVDDERRALAALVAEINDVVTFLAPERNVRLELIHYETHVFPDVGGPQDVIDEQIPVDYDIHLGIMWRRSGTPTKTADSGTIHEFDRALKHREQHGKPTIMFYFCTDAIPMPTTQEEIEQLQRVVKFRERLRTIGLTSTYPKRAEFRERARISLLRAIADIARDKPPERQPEVSVPEPLPIPAPLRELCEAYDSVRAKMPGGTARTRRLTEIFEEMKLRAPDARGALPLLKAHRSAGHRLAAVAILQVFPSRDELAWLADRMDPKTEKPFLGYQTAIALLQAARSLPSSDCQLLQAEVARARQLALRNPDDPPRIAALDYAIRELTVKCG